jgi:IS605 OrfB family transposase
LKLEYNLEQKSALTALVLAYQEALNFASQTAFELGKTSSASKIQKATYHEIRSKWSKLPTTMICGIARQVGSTFKTLWTRAKQHKENRKKGWTRERYNGLGKPPQFKSKTAILFYRNDYSWAKNQTVSVTTLDGRIKLKYSGYQNHLNLIKAGSHCGAAKLWYDRSSKQWYLIVSIELQKPDVDLASLRKVKGIDVGQRNLLVSVDSEGRVLFKKGGLVKAKCRHYAKVRSGLQEKGTRSAKRSLVRLSSRERRFRSDVNHKLALSVLEPSTLIGVEDLTGIRDRLRRRTGKRASEKQRQANRESSSWSYAELQGFITYKTFFFDSIVVAVDPRNTSKGCSKCGHVSDGNRPNGSVLFRCQACGRVVHSDKNGGDNILQRTVVRRQDLLSMGCLSITPEASNVDGSLATGAQMQQVTLRADLN